MYGGQEIIWPLGSEYLVKLKIFKLFKVFANFDEVEAYTSFLQNFTTFLAKPHNLQNITKMSVLVSNQRENVIVLFRENIKNGNKTLFTSMPLLFLYFYRSPHVPNVYVLQEYDLKDFDKIRQWFSEGVFHDFFTWKSFQIPTFAILVCIKEVDFNHRDRTTYASLLESITQLKPSKYVLYLF